VIVLASFGLAGLRILHARILVEQSFLGLHVWLRMDLWLRMDARMRYWLVVELRLLRLRRLLRLLLISRHDIAIKSECLRAYSQRCEKRKGCRCQDGHGFRPTVATGPRAGRQDIIVWNVRDDIIFDVDDLGKSRSTSSDSCAVSS
jgi:hypothetical protein